MHLSPTTARSATCIVVLALASAACGDPTTEAGAPAPYPAPHPSPPRIVDLGGPVLAAPEFVPIFFANDVAHDVEQLDAFLSAYGASEAWRAGTRQYGVGVATKRPAVQLAEDAPVSISQQEFDAWLAGELATEQALSPLPKGALVVVFFPEGTTFTSSAGVACESYDALHLEVALDAAHGGRHVPYVAAPRCNSFARFRGLDVVTAATSHELLEAATDPFVVSAPAWAAWDDEHAYWGQFGTELGDFCEIAESNFTRFADVPFVVQRTWSNDAAAAGQDPCVPAPTGSIYFGAAPVLPDHLGGGDHLLGVSMGSSTERTIDIDLFSDADVGGPWEVRAFDASAFRRSPAELHLSIEPSQGTNGDRLALSIGLLEGAPARIMPFYVKSSRSGRQTYWMGAVGP